MQLGSVEQVLAGGRAVLGDAVAGERAVRFTLTRAVESLEDVLRIALSRGRRIGVDDDDEDHQGHGGEDGHAANGRDGADGR